MMILYSIIALVAVVLFYIMIRREDARLKKHLDRCFLITKICQMWSRRMITPEQLAIGGSEHDHQTAYFCWCALHTHQYPMLEYAYAIPNGGHRKIATAGRLKAEGVKAGVPDVCLPYPNGKYHGLYIEFKIGTNKPSEKQFDFMEYLRVQSYSVHLCYTWQEAVSATLQYLTPYIYVTLGRKLLARRFNS